MPRTASSDTDRPLTVEEFAREHDLGAVFGQHSGFQIFADPETVRAPDVAFVRSDRLAAIPRRGYPQLAPDLVVEVLSPDDRPAEVLAKVGEWLEAGALLPWVLRQVLPAPGNAVATTSC